MGFYTNAAELAKAIENFKHSFTCGRSEGGAADVAKFRRYYEQLPKLEREAFRMNEPTLYRYWVKAPGRAKRVGTQIEMFD